MGRPRRVPCPEESPSLCLEPPERSTQAQARLKGPGTRGLSPREWQGRSSPCQNPPPKSPSAAASTVREPTNTCSPLGDSSCQSAHGKRAAGGKERDVSRLVTSKMFLN
ncbi:hypothetical protein NHX12_022600 [Muraenolepis orangiensis]|uniref:Uncharacterized protein n=1 Tax=Muraenolepis orangiensis TaxID=630683 RepID=A0A9Q0EQH6_9TELE|nr:hypothetical protein NHX12_022600 [Muraenolepis orangiensis]